MKKSALTPLLAGILLTCMIDFQSLLHPVASINPRYLESPVVHHKDVTFYGMGFIKHKLYLDDGDDKPTTPTQAASDLLAQYEG